jgi:C1A family cysteine protease
MTAELLKALAACPATVDWRLNVPNVMPPVKDQGRCGSCWAFAAATTMEICNAILNGNVESVSEQNLIDCTYGRPYYNDGCDGGW